MPKAFVVKYVGAYIHHTTMHDYCKKKPEPYYLSSFFASQEILPVLQQWLKSRVASYHTYISQQGI